MFLAAFTYDRQRRPRWDFSEVGLFRIGVKATSTFGRSGKLEILEDEPRTGVLRMTFSVDFGEARPTAGVVYSTITSEAVNP